MGKETIRFGNIEINKQKFHNHKNPISVYEVNIDRIVIFSRVSFGKTGFKYFIGYKNNKKQVSLCAILPK